MENDSLEWDNLMMQPGLWITQPAQVQPALKLVNRKVSNEMLTGLMTQAKSMGVDSDEWHFD
jgi:hypothetical protein